VRDLLEIDLATRSRELGPIACHDACHTSMAKRSVPTCAE